MDDAKPLLHSKRWYVYANEKGNLLKGGYLVEVDGHDGKKVIWGVFNYHVIEEPRCHDEIGLRGFDLIFFEKDEKGVGR